MMTRRERLMATLKGEPVDRPPVSFYEIKGVDDLRAFLEIPSPPQNGVVDTSCVVQGEERLEKQGTGGR